MVNVIVQTNAVAMKIVEGQLAVMASAVMAYAMLTEAVVGMNVVAMKTAMTDGRV